MIKFCIRVVEGVRGEWIDLRWGEFWDFIMSFVWVGIMVIELRDILIDVENIGRKVAVEGKIGDFKKCIFRDVY